MITIATDLRGTRTYSIPPPLLAVAKRVFPGRDEAGAIFLLARRLTADKFATIERLAMQNQDLAFERAAEWVARRLR